MDANKSLSLLFLTLNSCLPARPSNYSEIGVYFSMSRWYSKIGSVAMADETNTRAFESMCRLMS